MIGRRAVTSFAVPRFDDWEVFIETHDGLSVGFVSESEVERVAEGNAETNKAEKEDE